MNRKHIIFTLSLSIGLFSFLVCRYTNRDSNMVIASLKEAIKISQQSSFSTDECSSAFSKNLFEGILDNDIAIWFVRDVGKMHVKNAQPVFPMNFNQNLTSGDVIARAFVSPFGVPIKERFLVVFAQWGPFKTIIVSSDSDGNIHNYILLEEPECVLYQFYTLAVQITEENRLSLFGYYIHEKKIIEIRLHLQTSQEEYFTAIKNNDNELIGIR